MTTTRMDDSSKKQSPWWQKTVDILGGLAEAANIGIVIEVVARWLPSFRLICASGLFASLMAISDPLIYLFRAMIRLVRIIGREFFDIEFEEEKLGAHRWQTPADIIIMALFALSVATFFGAFLPPPVHLTIAWSLGLSALSIIGYFDYIWPEELAKQAYEDPSLTPKKQIDAENEYNKKKYSKRMFGALLVGLTLLLVCGSASAFAPPVVDIVLDVASRVGSIFLGLLACARFAHWCKPSVFSDVQAAVSTCCKGSSAAIATSLPALFPKQQTELSQKPASRVAKRIEAQQQPRVAPAKDVSLRFSPGRH